jgi:hypothetical protein
MELILKITFGLTLQICDGSRLDLGVWVYFGGNKIPGIGVYPGVLANSSKTKEKE